MKKFIRDCLQGVVMFALVMLIAWSLTLLYEHGYASGAAKRRMEEIGHTVYLHVGVVTNFVPLSNPLIRMPNGDPVWYSITVTNYSLGCEDWGGMSRFSI